MARLGVTVFQFYDMTPIEFHYAIDEANRMEEQRARIQYEVARRMTRHLLNMSMKSLSISLKEDKEVELFPWEVEKNKKIKPIQTPEEMAKILRGMAKSFNKSKKPRV